MDRDFAIDILNPADQEIVLNDLIILLQDAVESGASVGFVAPLAREVAAAYWRTQFEEASGAKRVMLIASEQGRIIGSVQLALASQPNGQHRGEVQRLIVLQTERKRGIGSALMRQLEIVAKGLGRTLLVLNTRTGDPPEALYGQLGYILVGTIPGYAQNPDGSLNTTSIMYRQLD